MIRQLLFLLSFCFPIVPFCQNISLDYYLPEEDYLAEIPTPAEYLGFEIGEWHLTHDQLVGYLKHLAAKSDRFSVQEYARSYEERPLIYLTITSPENHNKLEAIRQEHLNNLDPDQTVSNQEGRPVVVYQGMSIHGNEPSGANAAPLLAYYLAASQTEATQKLLSQTIILLDPCYNPDGFHRFASWVNSNKGNNLVMDPQSREFNEPWPEGRTNHYFFDLNRDWLPVQHPESQGRIRTFQQWKPNILTDHHEMGSNSTFFFQPGVPQRTNPLTPPENQELTEKIGRFHASALDQIGSLYFTQERFDDYYYGKGSTYPDINGCIGILFEQASSRGHLQESVNGPLSFPFTIRNQFTTGLSTLKAAQALRLELLDYQRDFYQQQTREAKKSEHAGYLLRAPQNPSKLKAFVAMMELHQIEVYQPSKELTLQGTSYPVAESVFIPTNQPQAGLVKAMFFQPTTFQDSLFYDISAWTMPLAFNLQYSLVKKGPDGQAAQGKRLKASDIPSQGAVSGQSMIGYYFSWADYLAPAFLYQLQKKGLHTKVSLYPFTDVEGKSYPAGTIFVASQNQPLSSEDLYLLLKKLCEQYPIQVKGATSGWNMPGPDLGSNDLEPLRQPKVLLITGQGTRSYEVGEIWHLLDQRYQMEVSLIDILQVKDADLSRYNVIIMASGSYRDLDAEKVKTWVQYGGTLICYQAAVGWAINQNLCRAKQKRNKPVSTDRRPYEKLGQDQGAQVIGGAIFAGQLDLTHPLAFGYTSSDLPIFRRGTLFLEAPKNPYAAPLRYTDNPLLAGYISKENEETLRNSSSIVVSGIGNGKVLCFADNTNFRAFWFGTNKLLANAMFFGSTISRSALE